MNISSVHISKYFEMNALILLCTNESFGSAGQMSNTQTVIDSVDMVYHSIS